MKLVVLAEPRSSSTYFMRQFKRSPVLQLVDTRYRELIKPQYRENTRKILGLEPVDDPQSWGRDIESTIEFIRRYPNGAWKTIAHAHGQPYLNFLTKLQDTTFVALRRQDVASAIASIISRQALSRVRPEVWDSPAKHDPIRFRDAVGILQQPSPWRYVDMIYWGVMRKTQAVVEAFPNAYHLSTEDFGPGFQHELGDRFQMTFDFSDYTTPSHYSEVFTDWKDYENVISHVLP